MTDNQPGDVTEPDVSDVWDVTAWTDSSKGGSTFRKVQLEHTERRASIMLKELPSGAALELRVPADLPGGFETVHRDTYHEVTYCHPFEAAKQEAERRAGQYEREGTWHVEGAPVLH